MKVFFMNENTKLKTLEHWNIGTLDNNEEEEK